MTSDRKELLPSGSAGRWHTEAQIPVTCHLSPVTLSASTIEVRACKYDQSIHRRWSARVIEISDPLIILRGVFEKEVRHSLLGVIAAGTISTEYYWMNRWYSVFEFVTPDTKSLKNYYCNVHLPPRCENQVLSFVDLEIDLLVEPNLTYQILDEDEFAANTVLFAYPEDVVRGARAAVTQLIGLVESRAFPFRAKTV